MKLTDKQIREIEKQAERSDRSIRLVISRTRAERRVVNAAVAWHKSRERGEHRVDLLHDAVRRLLLVRTKLRKSESSDV